MRGGARKLLNAVLLRHPIAVTLCLLATLSAAASRNEAMPIEPNSVALSDLRGKTLGGKPFDPSVLAGKTVLLDFWAVWCAPCIKAFPDLKKLHDEFEESEFEVVGVAVFSGTVRDVRRIVRRHNLDYPIILADDKLAAKFGVIGIPVYFLFGPDGELVKKYVGEVKDLYGKVSADMEQIRRASSRSL